MTLDAPRNVSLFDVDDVTTFGPVRDMTVTRVPVADVDEFCRRWHYTGYQGSVMWPYGLWDGFTLVGIVSYNLPTMNVCSTFFGQERWEWVAHMGRLVCADDAPKNCESRLIGESLKLLKLDRPQVRAVVTYAAQDQGHVGYVYQATNALYLGTGGDGHYYINSQGRVIGTYVNGWRVSNARAEEMQLTRVNAEPKHRYMYLLGNKTERREARALLRYPVLPYPKAQQ